MQKGKRIFHLQKHQTKNQPTKTATAEKMARPPGSELAMVMKQLLIDDRMNALIKKYDQVG
ncbi:MAG: hypothetical protein IJ812_05190 [Schwartzia sp.]|nr:hypothetical protein [Schwartzia sp. (in: firmicutes)]MBR1885782.1 hypothetical protein [Schwartzia sp. (in: firmicutes)]